MMKRVLVQVDEGTHAAWKSRAFAEGRSMSDLARVLIERAVLTERGTNHTATAGSQPAATSPRSVSADVAANIPEVGFVPPSTRTLPKDKVEASFDRSVAARLALRDGKCTADVARGTKCKLCGKVHS